LLGGIFYVEHTCLDFGRRFSGWLASVIMKTDKSMGLGANIGVGILGALIGGFVMNLIGKSGFSGFNLWSFIVALIGAIILLAIAKAIRK
jgi:uncharacterized membrane protein YeaQ/YmgE (transglycosylase-associated protein family)